MAIQGLTEVLKMQVFTKNDFGDLEVSDWATKELNRKSKLAQHFLKCYSRSKITSLYGAYKNPSTLKQRIFQQVNAIREKIGGYDPRIISHNTFVFTYAYVVSAFDGVYLLIETATTRYSIKLSY